MLPARKARIANRRFMYPPPRTSWHRPQHYFPTVARHSCILLLVVMFALYPSFCRLLYLNVSVPDGDTKHCTEACLRHMPDTCRRLNTVMPTGGPCHEHSDRSAISLAGRRAHYCLSLRSSYS